MNGNEISGLDIDLNSINLNDNNFSEDDPDTITHVRLLAWHYKFEKHKALKKELKKELMQVGWHPHRWWSRCVLEDYKLIQLLLKSYKRMSQ